MSRLLFCVAAPLLMTIGAGTVCADNNSGESKSTRSAGERAALVPTLNARPPRNATILFDGTGLNAWAKQKPKEWLVSDGPADNWQILPDGVLQVVPGAGSIITKQSFSDFQLHLEYRLLEQPTNGGVYLLARYEIGISASSEQSPNALSGYLGNVVGLKPQPPRIDASAALHQWQSFDIEFRAARFDETDNKVKNARVSVNHNGVKLYDQVEPARLKGAAKRLGEASSGPIMLQEHGVAYQFRNIWIMERVE